jgi:hypothetical protein
VAKARGGQLALHFWKKSWLNAYLALFLKVAVPNSASYYTKSQCSDPDLHGSTLNFIPESGSRLINLYTSLQFSQIFPKIQA